MITDNHRRGGRLFCLQTVFLPVSSSTLLGMAVHSTAIPVCVLTVKNTPSTLVKHSQHIALITVLVSLGMSVTPS
ncbi:unnamed protein product [Staurois parvus]|uniref:Uncharacterized protein n=1 Tax=Staurois parvus TaxID=386267 RepID=A0ABN9DH00_9NEOB|nr:unnamed protein product [Staurois parvus]